MSEPKPPSTTLQLLHRVGDGDAQAIDALIQHTSVRLTRLTRQMLQGFPGVGRWVEIEDVLQNALVRLLGALRAVKPATGQDFFALATLQIRRELIDLARHFAGPRGIGANHDSGPQGVDKSDDTHEPSSIAQWTEMHERIDALPPEEREIMDLLFYQGLSQAEAAEVLKLSLRTVQRRWHDALWKLHQVWNGEH